MSSTNVRVLNTFFELLTSDVGRTRDQIWRLEGYRNLSEEAFSSAFQRDKDALRDIGIIMTVTPGRHGERYAISPDSFADRRATFDAVDGALINMALGAWNEQDGAERGAMLTTKLRALSDGAEKPCAPLSVGLSGAHMIVDILTAIRNRQPITFMYESTRVSERAIEPWRIIMRGRGLYVWGLDLDCDEPRLFRTSRITLGVTLLGEPGDAGPIPDNLGDPFERLMVSPTLAIQDGQAQAVRDMCRAEGARSCEGEVSVADGWMLYRGQAAERSEWISAILAHVSHVVVRSPEWLREAIMTRLDAAAGWGCDDA